MVSTGNFDETLSIFAEPTDVIEDALQNVHPPMDGVLTAVLLLVLAEVGFRLGSRRYTQKREAPTGHIDTDAERIAAGRAHIPSGVGLLLLVVAGFGSSITGYGAGVDGVRTALVNLFLPLLITVVIVLIFDLSHPRQGLIGISQQPLIELQQSIAP